MFSERSLWLLWRKNCQGKKWNQSTWEAVVVFQEKDDGGFNGESREVLRSGWRGYTRILQGKRIGFADVGE